MAKIDPLEKIIRKWKRDPALFFREGLGFTPSNQQEEGCRVVAELVEAKTKVSVWGQLSEKEREDPKNKAKKPTADEVELAKKRGVSIASGHNTGKDRFLAGISYWWLLCFPYSKGLVRGRT